MALRDLEPRVQVIYQEIQWTLANLHHRNGVPATKVAQMASKIVGHVDSYLTDAGAVVEEQDIIDLITDMAKKHNNLASLTSLFDDALSVEAANFDTAFDLWDQLSMLLMKTEVQADNQKLFTVLGAIRRTSTAVERVVSKTNDIVHYLNISGGHKRETTVETHVETGPGGTSGGASISHTWGDRRRRRSPKV